MRIKWQDVSDDDLVMAKMLADGQVSFSIIKREYHSMFTELIEIVKPLESFCMSPVGASAEFLRLQLERREKSK